MPPPERDGGEALLPSALRDPHAAVALAHAGPAGQEAAARPGTSSSTSPCSSARRGRGTGVILNTNLEAVVIYDGFPYASSHDVPLLRACSPPGCRSVRTIARRKTTAEAGGDREALSAGARHLPALRQEARRDHLGPRGGGPAPRLLRGRGAAGAAPLDSGRRGPSDTRRRSSTSQEVRPEAGGHLPRAADSARQVHLQSNWIATWRVLRGQPVLAESSATTGRAGQPARAHGQHQEGQDAAAAALRRRRWFLRDQPRHLDLNKMVHQALLTAGRTS